MSKATSTIPPQMMLERLQSAEEAATVLADENAYFRKQLAQVKHELQITRNQCQRLEQTVADRDDQVDDAQRQLQQLTKRQRETEKALAAEMYAHEKDQAVWQDREFQYQEQFKMMQSQLMRKKDEEETARIAQTMNQDDSLKYLSEAREAQREMKEQERKMLSLHAEMERLQLELNASGERAGAQQLKLAYLENALAEKKEMVEALKDETGAYRKLLKDLTMQGEVRIDQLAKRRWSSALAAELNRACGASVEPNTMSPRSSIVHSRTQSHTSASNDDVMSRERHLEEDVAQLHFQLRELQEENVALTLYLNSVLTQILGVDQLQQLNERMNGDRPGHRKANSLALASAPVATEQTKASKRAQSMIVSRSQQGATQKAIQEAGEAEMGLWKKALKRMSTASWRTPTAPTPIEEEKTDEDVTATVVNEESVEDDDDDDVADTLSPAQNDAEQTEEPSTGPVSPGIDFVPQEVDDTSSEDDAPLRTEPLVV